MKPTLQIRKGNPLNGYSNTWLFLKHRKPYTNFDYRWIIAERDDGWIGAISLFPATHENALDMIVYEIELAKQAIQQIKGKLLK